MNASRMPARLAATILLGLMTLAGCATRNAAPATTPEQAYESYQALSDQNTPLKQLADHWDQDARDMFYRTTDSSGEYVPIETFESSLRYSRLFSDAPSAPEAVETTSDSSCLLLVGAASDGGSLALSVLLKKEDGHWKHSELFADYPDQSDSQPKRPSCESPKPFED